MTQQEWSEVLSTFHKLGWMDWVTFIVSIVSPIIMLASVLIAWKATKVAKESTELNIEMYEDQKREIENSYLPIFKVETIQVSSDIIRIRLYNMNENVISTSNFATTEFIKHFEKTETEKNLISMKFLGEFEENDQIKVWIYYTTLNHRNYSSEIKFRIIEGNVVIESVVTKDRG